MKWFPILQPWLDPQYQLIAQPPPGYDGGDTANREGVFMFGSFLLFNLGLMEANEFFFIQERYEKNLDLLNDPKHPGFLRRWPDPYYWGGQSDRFSRDQATPNVIGMGYLSSQAVRNPSRHLWNFFKDHCKRALLFTTNTRANWAVPGTAAYAWKLPDITVLGFWSLYIRAFNCKWLYPLMLIFDLDLVVNSLIKVYSYGKTPTNNDDLNHIMSLLQAEIAMPTPWSKLASWIYKKRAYPKLMAGQTATNSAQACLIAYFRGTNPGPKLEEIFEPITKHYFG